jgi:hypothetical protein
MCLHPRLSNTLDEITPGAVWVFGFRLGYVLVVPVPPISTNAGNIQVNIRREYIRVNERANNGE